MKLYHVVAMAKNRVIGKDNKLPWHFSEDLKFFKKLTMGNPIIMGRKTFDSIGKPLPGRFMIVLTKKNKVKKDFDDVWYESSLEDAIELAKSMKGNGVYIIGGAEIFRQTIDKIDGIYLTRIGIDFDGDASYPEIPDYFEEVSVEGLREANPVIQVVYYERRH